ncbi:IucA/IucC family protein [Streptomyces sp. NPDC005329]|uniref:IucA/IucC family protein n=1 Tax=Streptomyces sp. NPDC005329 TaxID=3157034 RepID=UPI0033BD3254
MSTALTRTPPGAPHPPGTDPLLHRDPAVAAGHAGTENLLRCRARETGAAPGPDGVLHMPVLGGAARLTTPVQYWSPCGRHRFEPVTLGSTTEAGLPPTPVDAITVAALIGSNIGRGGSGHLAILVAQVADSVVRTADILAYRRTAADPEHLLQFLRAEQSLLLGHPQHPAPKGRDGLAAALSAAYSPETHGAFRLHWYAVDRDLPAADSAEPLTAGAFGARRLADERQLLTLLRRFLAGPAVAATGSGLPAHLLDSPTLRCKANLLTRLEGLDELVGPVATQSVYVTLPNPVALP